MGRHSLANATYSTTAALVWLTTACGQVAGDLGVTHADPGPPVPKIGDASVADSGNELPYPRCFLDAGSAPNVVDEIYYFISYERGPNYLPCGIYTFVYDGPTSRTDPGNARVLFEHAGTVLFTAEYDWRTQVSSPPNPSPDLTGTSFRLDFDGYFTLNFRNANSGVTDLWNLRYNFDGKHVLVVRN